MSSKLIDQIIDELQEIKVHMSTYLLKGWVAPKQLVINRKVPSSDGLCSIPDAKASHCDLLKGHSLIVRNMQYYWLDNAKKWCKYLLSYEKITPSKIFAPAS